MEQETPATPTASTLYPPPSPHEVAEATRIRDDTDSNTIAGLQRLVFQSCQKYEEISRRSVEDARNYHRDVQNLASAVLEFNRNALQMQRDYSGFMEVARKPIQPRPTVAETVGHTVEHIVTELRRGIQATFGQDPELRDKAQGALEDAVEKGKALVGAIVQQGESAGDPASKPAATPAPSSEP